jgi:hypothetical protein
MPLSALSMPTIPTTLPGDVRSFLRDAGRRIERFQRDSRVPGFVPSDFEGAYAVLRALAADHFLRGHSFCEWGSGFGVVACLAAMLDFDSCGIEIEPELVEAAQTLADDFGLPVEFIRGSFIPAQSAACLAGREDFAWLSTAEDRCLEDQGIESADFDLVFAYPWPDEEWVVESIFEKHSAPGAVLVTHHGGEDFQIRRKTKK